MMKSVICPVCHVSLREYRHNGHGYQMCFNSRCLFAGIPRISIVFGANDDK